jgi:uncharacterized protein YndB with AHSA1/START domain
MMTAQNELKLSLPNDTDVLWERTFDAPSALVFDVLTKPEHVQNWMANYGYKLDATADVRVGGSFRYYFHNDGGESFVLSGDYLEVDPPSRLVSTEGLGEGPDIPRATNVMTLTERDGRTHMTIVMSFTSKQMRDEVLATGMESGAAIAYDQMDEYLVTLA